MKSRTLRLLSKQWQDEQSIFREGVRRRPDDPHAKSCGSVGAIPPKVSAVSPPHPRTRNIAVIRFRKHCLIKIALFELGHDHLLQHSPLCFLTLHGLRYPWLLAHT